MFTPIPMDSNNNETLTVSDRGDHITSRQMYTNATPSRETMTLIMDSAVDMSMVGQGFGILFQPGEMTTLWGAMAAMDGASYEIISTAVVVESPLYTQQYIIVINQEAYAPGKN